MNRGIPTPTVALTVISLLAAGGTGAQTAPSAPATAATPAAAAVKPVTITPSNTDIRDTVRDIAAQSGIPVLIGTEVTGKVTAHLTDVSPESALTAVTMVTGNRWSRLTVPAEKAAALTPDQALILVQAAEMLADDVVSVRTEGGPAVTVGVPPAATERTAVVYLVHTRVDPALIKAARAEALKRAEDKAEAARREAVAARMSEDARQDPHVVQAYSTLQKLNPDQVATLAREYMIHATPDQRRAIGEALARQRDEIREGVREQQQGQ